MTVSARRQVMERWRASVVVNDMALRNEVMRRRAGNTWVKPIDLC